MNDKTRQQEKRESNVLLNRGYKFEITYETEEGYFLPNKQKKVETIELREPTLAVLDLVSNIYLDMQITNIDNGDSINAAYTTAANNAELMAKVLAVFALGERCFINRNDNYVEDTAEIERLSNIIYHSVKPSDLVKMISICTALSNLPDFLASIRLTGASRTTAAKLIE